MTLWESLAGDPEMRVSGKADQVLVRDTQTCGWVPKGIFV